MDSNGNDDIAKRAMLVKMKTNRKKLFVLREDSASQPARLEYYDSEKKFKSGAAAKRSIILKNCFSINPKSDARHKHAIVLYTKDDCFGVAFENEAERQDWLTVMVELRSQSIEDSTLTMKPLFEHVWPVKVRARGLGCERAIPPGDYRLCLTNSDISLIRMRHEDADIVIPLDVVRRCGHSHDFFFLELGRSAVTGPGELWLQVEDSVISQNMHEAILTAMKNNTSVLPSFHIRTRTGSNVSQGQRSRKTPGSSLPGRSYTFSDSRGKVKTSSPLSRRISCETSSTSIAAGSLPDRYSRQDSDHPSIDDTDMGYPSSGSGRSMTPEECIKEEEVQEVQEDDYFPMNPNAQIPDLNTVPLPDVSDYLSFKPLGSTSVPDSDYMAMPGNVGTCKPSVTDHVPAQPESAGRGIALARAGSLAAKTGKSTADTDYMQMAVSQGAAKAAAETGVKRDTASRTRLSTTASAKATSDYVAMKVPTDEGYMDMKVGMNRVTDEPLHGSGSSVSSVMSLTSGTVSSSAVSSRSGNVEKPDVVAYHSLSRLQELSSEGYIEMSANSRNISSLQQNTPVHMHLDIIPSFLHDSDHERAAGTGGSEDFPPKRAYSVGSKPQPTKQLTSGSYVDMSVGVGAGLHQSLKNESEKSCSAPHLNEDTRTSHRPLSGAAAAEIGDHFMELDFHRKADAGGKDFRARASSGGSRDLTARMLSHNAKDALARITFFRRGTGGLSDSLRRPRTSTICQETLRPRTSSFGTSIDDSRPRSSSGGNARLRDVFGPETLLGARRLGAMHRVTSKRSSVESSADSLVAGADYLDMMCGTAAARNIPKTTQQPTDQYIVMRPGEMIAANQDTCEVSQRTARSTDQLSSSQEPAGSVGNVQSTPSSRDQPEPALTLAVSSESKVPAPFDLGVSFRLHYAASDQAGRSASRNAAVTDSAAAPDVLKSQQSAVSQDQSAVGRAALDQQAARTAESQSLSSTSLSHDYAQMDFSRSSKK